jgi:cholesterol transport system auxiliary component
MSPLRAFAFAAALALTGCAGAPGIPDTVYFRLPPRATVEPVARPLAQPLVIETFYADGLHSDQAIIYSTDADGGRLKTYHYQLWVDPPVRMLQRRLIATLRDARAAQVITDRLPNQVEALRISGRLERFERIRGTAGWEIAVTLALRVERRGGGEPLMLKEYVRQLPAGGETLRDSVAAVGGAIDDIYAEFLRDLLAAADA